VFVVGGRAFTSIILQRNCHEFIAYENLVRRPAAKGGRQAPAASSPITQAFPIVRRALKILADREVSPQTGLLKSTLLQLDSTFSERTYGASSFLDFAEKLAKQGLVQLKHSGRSVMVELNPGADEGEAVLAPAVAASAPAPARGNGAAAAAEPVPQAGDGPEGVRLAGEILAAATQARWPMYLRNVKQLLRAAGFDERRYGFGGLLDFLKACQREGLVRVERDRRGGLRVFQGPGVTRSGAPSFEGPVAPGAEAPPPVATFSEVEASPEAGREAEPDEGELQPAAVVDTTAELLGRAKPRRSRSRAAGGSGGGEAEAPARSTRRRVVKKAAATARSRRAKKPAGEAVDETRDA
jgi:hypothetical protein